MTKKQLLKGFAEALKKTDNKEEYKKFIRETLFGLGIYKIEDYFQILNMAGVK